VTQHTAGDKVYHCGTLTYTRPALAILFFWLLWGDFCYMLMETVTPSIMPLRFKELGATNTEMGLILGTIPGIIYSLLNPIISFKSDRFRSRWGRRIPFILASVPFLVVCLVLLAFGDQVGFWIHGKIGTTAISANRVAIWTFGVFLVIFTFFNTFVTSVFWYLFNDVVPEHLLARFMSWFRIISLGSAALYNFCIFRFAGSHATEIFIGAAVLYGVGFTLMCLNVKEGEYPPPPPYAGGEEGPLAAIKTYGLECHSHRHYWYLWVGTFIGSIGGGVATFGLLFSLAIGLNLTQIGYINGTVSVVVGVLILGSGWLADRYHPIRVVLAACIINLVLVLPANMIWLFWHPTPEKAFWVALTIAVGFGAPVAALQGVWDPPMLMRLFPRERYGQFCSTNAVWRSIGGIIGGGLAGGFLDVMTHYVGKERAYFFIPVWQLAFGIPAFLILLKLFKSWKRYGGDDRYVPPVPNLAKEIVQDT
jgi:MFS family permease